LKTCGKGKQETIREAGHKILNTENIETVNNHLEKATRRYRKVEHTCYDIDRIFEIDEPTKCDYCGEVIE
jgi:rRNA maturation endonuclease Nob1